MLCHFATMNFESSHVYKSESLFRNQGLKVKGVRYKRITMEIIKKDDRYSPILPLRRSADCILFVAKFLVLLFHF